MVRSGRPPVREVCDVFGRENVLRRLIGLLDGGEALPPDAVGVWLFEACADPEVLARCLSEGDISASTFETLSRVISPDFVPNDFGDDPWLIALGPIKRPPTKCLYLMTFLLARAFGRRIRNCADLVRVAFDEVYAATERSALPDDAWRLLDHRLYQSFLWPTWDRCARIRQTTVNLFVNKGLDQRSFVQITSRDDIFELLVEIAAESYSGPRYLNSIKTLSCMTRTIWSGCVQSKMPFGRMIAQHPSGGAAGKSQVAMCSEFRPIPPDNSKGDWQNGISSLNPGAQGARRIRLIVNRDFCSQCSSSV